ncbi:MAG: hypothetical protein ABIN58_02025, partial [candidate division WOR-3 bacterium]
QEILRRFNMYQPAVMVRALRSLVDKEITDKTEGRYEIVDLFFKRWIRMRFSGAGAPRCQCHWGDTNRRLGARLRRRGSRGLKVLRGVRPRKDGASNEAH